MLEVVVWAAVFTWFPRCKPIQAQKLHIPGFSSDRWAKLLLSPAASPDIVIWNKDSAAIKKQVGLLSCHLHSLHLYFSGSKRLLKLPLFDVLLFDSFAFGAIFKSFNISISCALTVWFLAPWTAQFYWTTQKTGQWCWFGSRLVQIHEAQQSFADAFTAFFLLETLNAKLICQNLAP